MVGIRPEEPGDQGGVFETHALAFARPNEARAVEALRQATCPSVSLVAVEAREIVGHVFVSPVTLEPAGKAARLGGLAPVGVTPKRQRAGIGSLLVRAALHRSREVGWRAVFLVGDPAYYARFGFALAAPLGFSYGDPHFDPVLQVAMLRPGALAGASGRVRFHPSFAENGCG